MLKPNAGSTIQTAREKAGLSRPELERLTRDRGFKVSEGTIFNIENGVSKRPYPRNIYALADALAIDHGDLFEQEAASA